MIFSATESVINENKYVTYDLGVFASLLEWQKKSQQRHARC